MSILRPKSISFSAAQSGVSTSLQEKKATLQEFKEKGPNKIRRRAVSPGFSIEGGTRRLIAAYFGIYSRLLCV